MHDAVAKFIVFTTLLISGVCTAAEHDQLKAFPAAEAGSERHVIVLPHKERGEEDAFKVELVAGKTMHTDGVNQLRLGAAIEAKPLTGWGYTFYAVTGPGQAASTLMAVPPGTPQVEKFVRGGSLLIDYNSRLPIVIYAPAGMEIRYRIWTAPAELEPAEKG